MRIYDPAEHSPNQLHGFSVGHDPGVSCTAHIAMILMVLGRLDRAATSMEECLRIAGSIEHPVSLDMARNFAAGFHQYLRNRDDVRELEDARFEHATEYGFEMFLHLGEIFRGWLLSEDGRGQEGVETIRRALTAYHETGAELGRPTYLGIFAEVCEKAGRPDEASSAIAEALEAGARTGLHYWDAELHRARGALLLRAGGRARRAATERDAEACFREAIAIARRQDANLFELRAAMSLCRLLHRQKRSRDARALLADVYGRFTEGFETRDLRDARALLEQLGAKS
jgi:adenylate cyclase